MDATAATPAAGGKAIAVRLAGRRAEFVAFRDRRYPGVPLAVLARELILAAVAGPPDPPAAAPGPGGLSKKQVVFLGTLLSDEFTADEVADLYARVVDGEGAADVR